MIGCGIIQQFGGRWKGGLEAIESMFDSASCLIANVAIGSVIGHDNLLYAGSVAQCSIFIEENKRIDE